MKRCGAAARLAEQERQAALKQAGEEEAARKAAAKAAYGGVSSEGAGGASTRVVRFSMDSVFKNDVAVRRFFTSPLGQSVTSKVPSISSKTSPAARWQAAATAALSAARSGVPGFAHYDNGGRSGVAHENSGSGPPSSQNSKR